MILIDGQEFKIPETGHPWSWENLEKKFTDVFEKNGSVSLVFDPKLKRTGVVKGKSVTQEPEVRQLSTKTRLINPKSKVLCEVIYTQKPRKNKNGDWEDGQRVITVRRGNGYTRNDRELLWYLWFISGEIKNNGNPHDDGSARLEFVFPHENVVKQNNSLLVITRMHGVVLDPDKLPEDKLRHLGRVLLIDGAGSMEEDFLRNRFAMDIAAEGQKGEKFRNDFDEAYKRMDTEGASIRALAQEAIDREIVKRGQGKWVLKGEEGQEDETIVGISPKEDAKETLILFLSEDDSWKERIEDKLSN